MKLAFIGLFVPYVFIFNTTLLEFPKTSVHQIATLAACLLGMVALSAAWWGWLWRPLARQSRVLIGLIGVCFLIGAALPP
jgi:TRAP-type uncharacterized transport system fused permease subunit